MGVVGRGDPLGRPHAFDLIRWLSAMLSIHVPPISAVSADALPSSSLDAGRRKRRLEAGVASVDSIDGDAAISWGDCWLN